MLVLCQKCRKQTLQFRVQKGLQVSIYKKVPYLFANDNLLKDSCS